MDKVYDHKKVEEPLYKKWEENGYFQPEVNPDGQPFTIILPPPNANGSLHFGHALMVIEDILIRFKRMQGFSSLWLPGADHAGFETQYVFEKNLQKEGKSRFDYDRETLYKMIWEYVLENKSGMENQLKKLGFSLDWSREKFTLDPEIIKIVYKTFKKLYDDGLIYRGNRLVNYCTRDGTSFSDLEVVSEEKEGTLYYIKFPIKEGDSVTIATTRPETLLGDVAVMVNPQDKRYKDLIGKTVVLPIVNREIPVIADEYVDMEFGTGAVKVTPAHDFNDYEIAKKHNLTYPPVIGFDGKMQNTHGVVDGLYVKQARAEVVKKLEEQGLLEKTVPHKMIIKTCYKCKTVLEPLPLEQWYIKIKPLAEKAIEAIKKGDITIHPKSFETWYFQWLENLNDWNISRQIVWGIRIPAWQCQNCKKNVILGSEATPESDSGQARMTGNNSWIITEDERVEKCPVCGSTNLKQDPDTFDTWFSSGQWPFATLQSTKPGDFDKFYPTSVMETGYDILKAWVSRMVMLGIYATNEAPFRDVVLHGLVNDPYGKKMSKSKGNVINPLELVEQYGADAVRFALVYGTALGHDQSLSYPKLDAMRKFTNKLWNMGRFIHMNRTQNSKVKSQNFEELEKLAEHENDKDMIKQTKELSERVTQNLEKYDFNHASQELYEFIWHVYADKYIEDVKNRMNENSYLILNTLYLILLKLLHPFMPFVTEELYQQLKLGDKMLIIESWPNKLY